MGNVKEYVCGYQHCKHNGVKVPSDEAVKDGTRYYHSDCHEEKQDKQKIFDLYYKCYKSTEDYHLVRKVLVQLINVQQFTSEYVLYVLCQAIRNKIPFKGIFTLSWLVKNDMQIKKKYDGYKIKEKIKDFTFDDTQTIKREDSTYKKQSETTWEDTLFG
jgi:hypothetical protein